MLLLASLLVPFQFRPTVICSKAFETARDLMSIYLDTSYWHPFVSGSNTHHLSSFVSHVLLFIQLSKAFVLVLITPR